MSYEGRLSNNYSAAGTLKLIQCASQAISDRIAKARRVCREFQELSAMSNIELQDIGIGREDILAVLSGSYDASLHRS